MAGELEISYFVQQCADEFLARFPRLQQFTEFRRYESASPAAEFRVEVPARRTGGSRAALTYTATNGFVAVGWDNCAQMGVIVPGLRDGRVRCSHWGLSYSGISLQRKE